jgi:phosphatidylglycerophosphatase A
MILDELDDLLLFVLIQSETKSWKTKSLALHLGMLLDRYNFVLIAIFFKHGGLSPFIDDLVGSIVANVK